MGILFCVEEIIDRHHFQLVGIEFNDRLEDQPANAAKTIDTNFYFTHCSYLRDFVKFYHERVMVIAN